jgi:hypothetical protein
MEAHMRAIYYDKVFVAPPARAQQAVDRRKLHKLIEWEFGDDMRDPRFLPGWYILPGLALAGIIVAFVA